MQVVIVNQQSISCSVGTYRKKKELFIWAYTRIAPTVMRMRIQYLLASYIYGNNLAMIILKQDTIKFITSHNPVHHDQELLASYC